RLRSIAPNCRSRIGVPPVVAGGVDDSVTGTVNAWLPISPLAVNWVTPLTMLEVMFVILIGRMVENWCGPAVDTSAAPRAGAAIDAGEDITSRSSSLSTESRVE